MNMRVPSGAPSLTLPSAVLDRLMPMHVSLNHDGHVRHAGPTIAKILGLAEGTGPSVFDVFDIRRPVGITGFPDLIVAAGARLSLVPKAAPQLTLRGVFMPLSDQDGAILDTSFGLSFARGVKDFCLTLSDFSPCDQTVELLYLHEANTSTAELSRNLSERLQCAHAAAQHQARTDVLTGLGNRRAIDDELERLLSSRNHDFTLMHLDLDHFKNVNDTFGHAAGDAVLLEVGRILDQDLRRNDFAARVGGDEFLTILRPALAPDVAGHIAHRLIERIEKPVRVKNNLCRISASIGLVSTTQYAVRPTVEQIMEDVDEALYRAKNGGRGRYSMFNTDEP